MLPNQRNQNPKLINQQNLPLIIIINQLPINPIAEPIQQPLQLPSQQPGQQQLLQQPPQPPNLDPMAYAPIAKLDNFMGEKDDAQIWLNDVEKAITANEWNDAHIMQAIPYFLKDTANSCNNNNINCLVNTFTTMKQRETEAVTTYLGCFHQNLCQIQAIDANYFTAPQILNQFICGLHSSILQHVHPLYPGTLQDAVTRARNFKSAESEANHAQAVNLVINESSELDSKLENLHNNAIIKETLIVPKINHTHLHQPINSGNRKRVSAIIVVNKNISKLTVAIPNSESVPKSKPICLPTSDAVISLLVSSISTSNLSAAVTSNISTTATNNLSTPTDPNTTPKLTTQQNPKTENDSTELEIDDGSPSTDPQFFTATIWITPAEFGYWSTPESEFPELFKSPEQPLTSNISPATITKNESLSTIFPFEFKETAVIPLFSGAAIEAKPITAIYTDAKVKGQSIKLILDSGFAGSIITKQLMDQLGHRVDRAASARIITANGATKTPIGEIDNFLFEVNGIMTPIKVLVIEATQYQALVETPANVSELTHMCSGHHNKLLPILFWDDSNKEKGKQKEELTWETNDLTWTDNDKKEDKENKEKAKEEETTQTTIAYTTYTIPQRSTYH
ncbi:hypothetical protein G9A89_023598 [Geosiphon pyriformis]|nr:hypothetical protein G9A89_023598 [Geosiphon pyriformis]